MNDEVLAPPPLPHLTGAPVGIRSGEWKDAPRIVRDARLVNFLGLVLCVLIGTVTGFMVFSGASENRDEDLGGLIAYVVMAAAYLWLAHGHKRGLRAAWTVQIVFSCVGLLGFPIGTLINASILSRWFKPETKAWFGCD